MQAQHNVGVIAQQEIKFKKDAEGEKRAEEELLQKKKVELAAPLSKRKQIKLNNLRHELFPPTSSSKTNSSFEVDSDDSSDSNSSASLLKQKQIKSNNLAHSSLPPPSSSKTNYSSSEVQFLVLSNLYPVVVYYPRKCTKVYVRFTTKMKAHHEGNKESAV